MKYVNHKYDSVNEKKRYAYLAHDLPFGEEIVSLVREFEARATPEARLANDADQLELIATLNEQLDLGKERAAGWIVSAQARLKTATAQKLVASSDSSGEPQPRLQDKRDYLVIYVETMNGPV